MSAKMKTPTVVWFLAVFTIQKLYWYLFNLSEPYFKCLKFISWLPVKEIFIYTKNSNSWLNDNFKNKIKPFLAMLIVGGNQLIIRWVPEVLSDHKNYLAPAWKEMFNLFEFDLTAKRYSHYKQHKLRNRFGKLAIARSAKDGGCLLNSRKGPPICKI